MGTPALTTRGMKEAEFRKIAEFMDEAAQIALRIQKTSGKMLKDFVIAIEVQLRPSMYTCSVSVWMHHIFFFHFLSPRRACSLNVIPCYFSMTFVSAGTRSWIFLSSFHVLPGSCPWLLYCLRDFIDKYRTPSFSMSSAMSRRMRT